MTNDEHKTLIEAALFIAGRPLSLAELKELTKLDEPAINSLINEMSSDYDSHSFKIMKNNDLFELRVKTEHSKKVMHLAPNQDFSRGLLQTLAVIAYKNPIKQSVVIKIRGNRCYDHMVELEKRGLIKREPWGHTNKISITNHFLEYFGLETPEDVKTAFSKFKVDIEKLETGRKKMIMKDGRVQEKVNGKVEEKIVEKTVETKPPNI